MAERLFDDQSMAEMRATMDANLPYACDIQVDVGTLHNGAHRHAWQSGAKVKCSLTPIGTNDAQQSDQRQPIGQWTVRFKAGTNVTPRNRLIVTGTEAGQSFTRTLIVVGVDGPKAFEASRRCTCRDATAAEV